ncbi:MAG: ATP-binding cassette domain-containing protein [Malacoplasma sp.]|nr:ATP-binding cassette domain-containing protein [Malacoplasma sp.]
MVFQFSEYQLFKTTIEKDISFGPVSLKIPKIKVNEINGKRLFEALSTIYFDEILAFFNITFKEDNFSDFNSFLNANELRIKFKIQNSRDCAKVKITNKSNLVWKKQIRFSTITESEYVHQLALKYLTKMGLDESYLDRSPFGLSGGQKKRVAIAGILAIEPKILVFDEPTAGLDPQGEQEMLDIILECKKNNQTIIVITHSMDHVLEVGDYVIVMDEGEIMMHGTPYKVFTNPNLYLHSKMEKPKVIDFIDSLVAKNSKFKQLYDLQPRNIVELTDAIQKIVAKSKTK